MDKQNPQRQTDGHDNPPYDHLLQIVYRNLDKINGSIRADFGAVMEQQEIQLSPSQIQALITIFELPPPVYAKQLARGLRLTPGAISQLVDSLQVCGYISRSSNPQDRRMSHLSLTGKGQDMVAFCNEAYNSLLKRAMATLDSAELQQLTNIQRKILQHMESNERDTTIDNGPARPGGPQP